jgi:hypothetical protein
VRRELSHCFRAAIRDGCEEARDWLPPLKMSLTTFVKLQAKAKTRPLELKFFLSPNTADIGPHSHF